MSPHFPPVNAADMHRLRQGLPYFEQYGWNPVVFTVSPEFVEQSCDPILLETVPDHVEVHSVKAYSTRWTRKVGLGNLGFRSWFQYRNAIDAYLRQNKVDLIYFSTTVFTLISLGRYWKNKFGVPFVVDLQDPWRNDYYLELSRKDRPKKFWFDYRQKKYLEGRTMPWVDGIVSVSDGYVATMKQRYPELREMDCITMPFGVLPRDIEVARAMESKRPKEDFLRIIYAGRGGLDMDFVLSALFRAFAKGLATDKKLFKRVRFQFVGTSYAASGKGVKTVTPVAERYSVASYVEEKTDRLPYFEALRFLLDADVLFVPGSTDSNYTASKIFPYILAEKPLLAVFNADSSVVDIVESTKSGEMVVFNNGDSVDDLSVLVYRQLKSLLERLPFRPETDWDAFSPYTANEMTWKQCAYFDQVIDAA